MTTPQALAAAVLRAARVTEALCTGTERETVLRSDAALLKEAARLIAGMGEPAFWCAERALDGKASATTVARKRTDPTFTIPLYAYAAPEPRCATCGGSKVIHSGHGGYGTQPCPTCTPSAEAGK